MGLFSTIVNKLRNIRYSMSAVFSKRLYTFGAIYHGSYTNYKHDPNPLVFIMYSDAKYTHALNCHYMSESDKAWFARSLFMIKKYGQSIDGRVFYQYLKQHRISIVKSCYRVYFTGMCKYRLVSAGITPLEKMVYPSSERFVLMLNAALGQDKLSAPPRQVAYSADELRNRIVESLNAVPIQRTPLGTQEISGSMGKASWLK